MLYPLIDARPRIKVRVENLPVRSLVPARPRFTSVPVEVLFSDITEKAAADYVAVEKMRGQQDADYLLSINESRRVDRDYDRDRYGFDVDYRHPLETLSIHNAGRLYNPNMVWYGYDINEPLYYVEETAQGFHVGINSRRAREYAADYAASFTYDAGESWNYDDERV